VLAVGDEQVDRLGSSNETLAPICATFAFERPYEVAFVCH